ncbi:MAG: hypothetical protein PHR68_01365 [Candidatus Gracilibacteria bacterium]|nr:hypothetical protein [Candidatus Gracilibacteria bacterium]
MNSGDIKIENSYCKNIDELIKSPDFIRIFKIVLDGNKKYNSGYYLSILDKINKDEILDKKEKSDFIILLLDADLKKNGENIIKKIKGFSLEDAKNFLDNYSTNNIIPELINKTSRNLIEILGGTKIEKVEIFENNDKFALYKDISTNKYCIQKIENENNIKKDDFIFDYISDFEEINGEYFYCAKINNKIGYIKLSNTYKYQENIVFDYISDFEEINGEYYYLAEINNKIGYIKFGEEINYKENIIFDKVLNIEEINGEIYYYAKKDKKCGHIKFGEENKWQENIIFDKVFNIDGNIMTITGLLRVNGDILNLVSKNGKEGIIKMGEENKWQENIIFDLINYNYNPIEKNDNFYSFSGKIGKIKGEVDYKNEIFTYKKWMGLIKVKISFEDIKNGKLN